VRRRILDDRFEPHISCCLDIEHCHRFLWNQNEFFVIFYLELYYTYRYNPNINLNDLIKHSRSASFQVYLCILCKVLRLECACRKYCWSSAPLRCKRPTQNLWVIHSYSRNTPPSWLQACRELNISHSYSSRPSNSHLQTMQTLYRIYLLPIIPCRQLAPTKLVITIIHQQLILANASRYLKLVLVHDQDRLGKNNTAGSSWTRVKIKRNTSEDNLPL
jgi:hypothetical protein